MRKLSALTAGRLAALFRATRARFRAAGFLKLCGAAGGSKPG